MKSRLFGISWSLRFGAPLISIVLAIKLKFICFSYIFTFQSKSDEDDLSELKSSLIIDLY